MIGRSRSSSRNLRNIRLVGPFQSNGCLPFSSHSMEPPTFPALQLFPKRRIKPPVFRAQRTSKKEGNIACSYELRGFYDLYPSWITSVDYLDTVTSLSRQVELRIRP